jgi:hypothetical protein
MNGDLPTQITGGLFIQGNRISIRWFSRVFRLGRPKNSHAHAKTYKKGRNLDAIALAVHRRRPDVLALTMGLPDHLHLYAPIFHLLCLWLVAAGVVLLSGGLRLGT